MMRRVMLPSLLLLFACSRTPTTVEESTTLLEDSTDPRDHASTEELTALFSEVEAAVAASDEARLRALSTHRDFLVRIRAVKALGRAEFVTQPEPQGALMRALSDPHWLVRSFAAKGLARSGNRGALGSLRARERCEPNDKVRGFIEAAIRAIES